MKHSLLDKALAALRPTIRPSFRALATTRHGPITPTDLTSALDAHLVDMVAATRKNEFIDAELGVRVAQACRKLLDAWSELAAEERQLVAAAVTYFVQTSDANNDFLSPLGFEDDAEVVTAVAQAIDRADLCVLPK